MKALKVIGAIVLMFVVAVFVIANIMPSSYRVERSIDIAAPPAVVFGEVDDLSRWTAWSPWIARDPGIRNAYSGPSAGVGAKVTWTSDGSGAGTQVIVVSKPPSRIETDLDFGEQGISRAYFDFVPQDGGTRVTWGLSGEMSGPLGGLLAAQMDRWIGADYEDGLRRLEAHVEALSPAAVTPTDDADAGVE